MCDKKNNEQGEWWKCFQNIDHLHNEFREAMRNVESAEELSLASRAACQDFCRKIHAVYGIKAPVVGFHADGEVDLTWRREDYGVLNIAFSGEAYYTYAAVFYKKGRIIERQKGRIPEKEEIEENIINLIKRF